jgi:hypothetical protein
MLSILSVSFSTVPHDQASLKKTLSEISAELDHVVKSVPSLVSLRLSLLTLFPTSQA